MGSFPFFLFRMVCKAHKFSSTPCRAKMLWDIIRIYKIHFIKIPEISQPPVSVLSAALSRASPHLFHRI